MHSKSTGQEVFAWVEVVQIDANPWQPRSLFPDDSLHELALSIAEVGVLQPLIVRPTRGGRFELVAGERRLRAAKLAGLERVPILVRSTTNQATLEIALIENIQREEIAPLECARAYRQLIREFGLTQEQIAEKVGKARSSVANTLRLLGLPPKIQNGLETGRISEGHARAILGFPHLDQQLAAYAQILALGLSVRDIERLATREPRRRTLPKPAPAGEWTALEDALSIHLGARVKLDRTPKGGALVVRFSSEEELAGIVERLGLK